MRFIAAKIVKNKKSRRFQRDFQKSPDFPIFSYNVLPIQQKVVFLHRILNIIKK